MATPKKTATKKPRAVRATRTREELREDLDEVVRTAAADEEQDEAAQEASTREAHRAKQATKQIDIPSVLQQITATKIKLSQALDEHALQLTQELQTLGTVRLAIEREEEELSNLHSKEVIASSIKTLISDYHQKQVELETEFVEKQQALAKTFTEQEQYFSEKLDEKKKTSARQEADYSYNLQLARKKEQDSYDAEMRVRDLSNEYKQRELEAQWAQREAFLKANEATLADLQGKVAAHPAELDAAVKREVSIVGNSLKRDHAHEIAILTAQHNSKVQILESEKKSLNETSARLVQQIADLHAQLSAAQNHIQKLGSDALSSVSGNAALAALQQANANNGSASKSKPQ